VDLLCVSSPGHAIHVGLALRHWSKILKCKTINLLMQCVKGFGIISKNGKFVRFGITRPTKLRALRNLEKAGLIKIHWNKHKAPTVPLSIFSKPLISSY